MLIKSTQPVKCDKCNRMFQPFTIQEAEYHCENCGKRYNLCPSCAKDARCNCGAELDDVCTINGMRIIY